MTGTFGTSGIRLRTASRALKVRVLVALEVSSIVWQKEDRIFSKVPSVVDKTDSYRHRE